MDLLLIKEIIISMFFPVTKGMQCTFHVTVWVGQSKLTSVLKTLPKAAPVKVMRLAAWVFFTCV